MIVGDHIGGIVFCLVVCAIVIRIVLHAGKEPPAIKTPRDRSKDTQLGFWIGFRF
jgi:hypothetical protein